MQTHNQIKVTLEVNGEVQEFWVALASDLEILQLKNIISEKVDTL